VSIFFDKKLTFYFIFIYLFAVTPIWVKAKYIHSYKISDRKQAEKRITTCTLVLLKFRLKLWPMWTYFRNSNNCFIKSQTVGKSSNWGFRICWICILGWSVLKLGITLWKAPIKLSLNILFELQCRKKWCSLSIPIQLSHNLCFFGIFLYLPISFFKLWSLMRNFVRSCLFLEVKTNTTNTNKTWALLQTPRGQDKHY
jgi:hypothetical protein